MGLPFDCDEWRRLFEPDIVPLPIILRVDAVCGYGGSGDGILADGSFYHPTSQPPFDLLNDKQFIAEIM